MRALLIAAALLLLAACNRGGEEETSSPSLPPAAAMARQASAMTFDQKLDALDRDLGMILEQGLDDNGRLLLIRAEALTDRLIEGRLPVTWLAAGYSVESRLRQLQALADRVLAEQRRGLPEDIILDDVRALRASVQDLQTQLARPGAGEMPPSLDSLLAGVGRDGGAPGAGGAASAGETESDEAEEEEAEEPAGGGGLLGQPVD